MMKMGGLFSDFESVRTGGRLYMLHLPLLLKPSALEDLVLIVRVCRSPRSRTATFPTWSGSGPVLRKIAKRSSRA